MKILLAIDESHGSEGAVHRLRTEGDPRKTDVLVLHVVEPLPLHPTWRAEFAVMRKKQKKQAQELVAGVARELRTAGFSPETMLKRGDPGVMILKVAREWSADLIILGSHKRNWLGRLLTKSVSDNVVRHATCTVEVVPTKRFEKS